MDMYIGDTLSRSRGAFTNHVGVYLGNGRVLHNTPENNPHISDFASFTNNQPVTIKNNGLNPRLVFERVKQVLSSNLKYDLLTNNCDHTTSFVTKGYKYSGQLLACIIATIGAGYLISKIVRR